MDTGSLDHIMLPHARVCWEQCTKLLGQLLQYLHAQLQQEVLTTSMLGVWHATAWQFNVLGLVRAGWLVFIPSVHANGLHQLCSMFKRRMQLEEYEECKVCQHSCAALV